jgi:lipopolysaccharide export system protein LptC
MAYRIGSWILVGLAVGLMAWFLWSANVFDSAGPGPPDPDVADTTARGQVEVKRSTLLTSDRQNRPLLVRAARAVQPEGAKDRIDLEDVTGEIERNGSVLKFRSDRAQYDNKADRIDLSGNVEVVSPRSFVATLQSAQVSLTGRNATSDEPVRVTFDGGVIDAGGVTVENDGARIVFRNRVRTVIRSNEGQVQQVQ